MPLNIITIMCVIFYLGLQISTFIVCFVQLSWAGSEQKLDISFEVWSKQSAFNISYFLFIVFHLMLSNFVTHGSIDFIKLSASRLN